VIAPASEDQEADRALARLADRRVEKRRPVELPVVPHRRVRVLDERVHDRRALLVKGAARERHERASLQEAA